MNNTKYFKYTNEQLEYIKEKDGKLKVLIEEYREVKRELTENGFYAVMYAIIGQLISTKTASKIFTNFKELYKDHNDVLRADVLDIKSLGLSMKKTTYIYDICTLLKEGRLDLDKISNMNEDDAIKELVKLNGIGVWSAKIILLFGFNKMNLSIYEDLALRVALADIYNITNITKKEYDSIMRRFEPYKSLASLFLWRHYHALQTKI